MSSPADRKYTDSHEWAKADGQVVTLGVTQHAVDALTDVTYVEMKPAGTKVQFSGAGGLRTLAAPGASGLAPTRRSAGRPRCAGGEARLG